MKIAIAFNSKDRVELSKQSMQRLAGRKLDCYWFDGSKTQEGKDFHKYDTRINWKGRNRLIGGPDRAIVYALTTLLANPEYTHVGLLENDVMLGHNWFTDCLQLFNYSTSEGLNVGAVSARSYVDRVLIQRDKYAVLHNAGAGHIIFTRAAAEIILHNYRTGWWPENREIFAQLSGVDIAKFAAFSGNEQPVTADWAFDAMLASNGLATVAPTPCQAEMIGQNLEEQGLKIVNAPVEERRDDIAFHRFRKSLNDITEGRLRIHPCDWKFRMGKSICFFPHHLAKLGVVFSGDWRITWNQASGPFTYVAGPGGACLTVPIFGTCFFHLSGAGAVKLRDEQSGYKSSPQLPPDGQGAVVAVPGGMMYRNVTLECSEGVAFGGIECDLDQPFNPKAIFDFSSLPEMAEQKT